MPGDEPNDAAMEEAGDSPPDSQQQPAQQSAPAQDIMSVEAEPDWSALCLSAAAAKTSTTYEELQVLARKHFTGKLSADAKSSPSELLSALVVSLEPVLGGSSDDGDANNHKRRGAVKPKVRALHILCGAIEGCSLSSSSSADNDDCGGLTPAVVSLLGQFLASYCLPYEQDYTIIDPEDDEDGDVAMTGGVDDNGDDVGEAVRDAAIMAVAALAAAECQPSIDEDAATAPAGAACQLLLRRLHLAQRAVECRCLSDDMTDYEHRYIDHGYGDADADRHDDALEGLGTLPRARRSACFSALEGAVAGCDASASSSAVVEGLKSSSMVGRKVRREVHGFVQFVATCLHGETDPRCLRQMLRLLHRCQVVFLPLFALDGGDTTAGGDDAPENDDNDMDVDGNGQKRGENVETFPTVSIFDAVAPYYPIKFTPPPNDPYGITRDGLRDALMAIMCVVEKKKGQQAVEENGNGNVVETMTSLSAKLFMERLVPPKSLDPYGDDNY